MHRVFIVSPQTRRTFQSRLTSYRSSRFTSPSKSLQSTCSSPRSTSRSRSSCDSSCRCSTSPSNGNAHLPISTVLTGSALSSCRFPFATSPQQSTSSRSEKTRQTTIPTRSNNGSSPNPPSDAGMDRFWDPTFGTLHRSETSTFLWRSSREERCKGSFTGDHQRSQEHSFDCRDGYQCWRRSYIFSLS